MANFTAADVKRLREETDAPMMECQAALKEADGDYEKAKALLREKGKAAAAKRTDRSTAAGVVAVSHSADHQKIGIAVLECETDFVARNEGFIGVAEEIAEIFLHNDPGNDPLSIKHGDKTVGTIIEETIAKFRENTKLTAFAHVSSGSHLASYVHHDKLKAYVIEVGGDASVEIKGNVGRQVAIQCVAFPPEFLKKDDVPQDKLASELEIEKQRAINEGKPENIAENIAKGRVNKEWISRVVLTEQPFYKDPAKTVGQYLKEEGGNSEILSFLSFRVGGNS